MVFVKSEEPGQRDSAATSAASANASSRYFCIAQLSDLHLFDPQHMMLRDFMSKRLLGYLSWRLYRQSRHKFDFRPALGEALEAAGVDHIVVTGDLTHLGHGADFESAGSFLRQLGGSDRITLIPGNHDAYVEQPWRNKKFSLMAYLSSDPVAKNAGSPAPDEQPRQKWPTLRIRNGIAIIGVCSACPTRPFLATGTIGPGQQQKLGQILAQTAGQALFRLVLVHHPPVPGLVGRRRHLTDHAALADTIGRTGAELILHGHTHRFCEAAVDGPFGKIPVIGVPSLTALSGRAGRRAGFHLYRIRRAGSAWEAELTAYRYCLPQNAFVAAASRMLSIPLPVKAQSASRQKLT